MLLPARQLEHWNDINSGHLIFGTICCPIAVLRRDHVCAGVGMVKRGVDDARLHSAADSGAQDGFARAACDGNPHAVLNAALFSVVSMDLEHILLMPQHVIRTARLSADIVLRKDSAGGED